METLQLLQFDLTEECPLFCSHCSNSSGPTQKLQFPFETLARLIEEAGQLRVSNLVFSGGEPLLYSRLHRALRCAFAARLPVSIFSTGVADRKTRLPIGVNEWIALKLSGLSTAAFSIYSSSQCRQLHNDIVRLKPQSGDAFEVNEQAIIAARLAGLDVQVHYIPSNQSVGTLRDIHRWAIELGCSVLHIQMPTLQGRNISSRSVCVDPEQETTLLNEIRGLLPLSSRTAIHVSRFWRYKWGWPQSLDQEGRSQLIIRSDGFVSVCNACKYLSQGQVRENVLLSRRSLAAIWNDSAEPARTHNCLEDRPHAEAAKASSGRSRVSVVPEDVLLS